MARLREWSHKTKAVPRSADPVGTEATEADSEDELYQAALDVVRRTHRANVSLLERALRIGYTRAARLIDRMEEQGIVGPPRGADSREILVNLDDDIPANPKAVGPSALRYPPSMQAPMRTSSRTPRALDKKVAPASTERPATGRRDGSAGKDFAEEDGRKKLPDTVTQTSIDPVPVPENLLDEGFFVSRKTRTAALEKLRSIKEELKTGDPSILSWKEIEERMQASYFGNAGGCVLPPFMNVGRILLENKDDESPFRKSMCERLRREEFPCLLRFRDCPGICFSGESENLALQAQLCVLRLLLSVHPNYVNFTLVDLATVGRAMKLLSPLRSVLNYSLVTQDNEIESVFRKLLSVVGDRSTGTLSRYDWLWQYNEDNPAAAEPYHVVMLASGKEGIGVESAKLLGQLIRNGNACRAGVYFILCDNRVDAESDETDAQFRERIDSIWRSCQRSMGKVIVEADKTEVSQEGWIDTRDDHRLADFRMESVIPTHDILDAVQRKIVASGKSRGSDIVRIPMPEADWWKKDSREGLTVPIGVQSGAELQYFVLGEGGIVYNALVGGTVGTGKTVLLHNLILGAARLYSPTELRMHLLDYKEGTEFACYRTLPHVDNLSIGPNVEFGLDVLNALSEEIGRRGKIFKEAGVSNLAAYREKTGLAMPRHLVVIDEFQVLWTNEAYGERAGTKMTDLVRRGRSFGINFVLSTQSLRGANLEPAAKENLSLRICLRLPESDCEEFLSPGNMVAASFTKAGEAVYNARGGHYDGNVRFRAAYLSGSEIVPIIRKVKELALAKGILVAKPNIYEGDEFVPLSALSKESGNGFLCIGRTTGIRPVVARIPVEGPGFRVLAIVGRDKAKRETVFQTLAQQFASMGIETKELGDGSLKPETERWRRWNEGQEPIEACPRVYVVRNVDRLRDAKEYDVQRAFGGMIGGAPDGASSLLLLDATKYFDLTRVLNGTDSSAMTGLLLLDEDAARDVLNRYIRLGATEGMWTGPGMEDGRKVALATRDI